MVNTINICFTVHGYMELGETVSNIWKFPVHSLYSVNFWFLVEELKAKKVLVQHVETVTTSETSIDIVQSFVVSMNVYVIFFWPHHSAFAVLV